MGVGELTGAMSEGNGWKFDVETLSFYPGGDDAYGIPELNVERKHLADIPRNCQPWDTPST